jgi:SAM-dependent methyltransferase
MTTESHVGDDTETTSDTLPLAQVGEDRVPGHWLLARLGKRVLRPGGAELSRTMVDALGIRADDDVVEFAPGLGHTARVLLAQQPASYRGVDADDDAVRLVRKVVEPLGGSCTTGQAWDTGLAEDSASVVVGEAMLTMQSDTHKADIVAEARRVLREGGRYAIHELAIVPDDLDENILAAIRKDLSSSIRVGARPLTVSAWRELLATGGFDVEAVHTAPMHLLEPRRLVADEGVAGAARFGFNVARDRAARRRVLARRRVFRTHSDHLGAVAIVARAR